MTDDIISDTRSVAIGGGTITAIPVTVPVGKWLLFAIINMPPGVGGYAAFGFEPTHVLYNIGGSVTGVTNSLVNLGNNAIAYGNNITTGSVTVNFNVWSSNQFTGTFKFFGIKLP
jgi:hypothetical protein